MRILISLLLLVWPAWLFAETRVALVLASSQYEALRPLDNPLNDARLVEDKLLALGFEVYSETNRDLRRMRRALDNFAEDAAGADVALIYFAGHGMEVAGQNMLLPVDAPAGTVAELTAGALPLDDLARTLQEVAPVGLLIVDACRSDPFGGAGRGAVALRRAPEVKPGLARIGRSDNLLYAFAAAPGQAASDGQGANSPFTEALARHLATPGLEIRQVLTLVQQDVYDRTRGRQLPYVESGLPSVVFAGGQSALPEREVLLLSMARMTPDHRALIERVASEHDMPLAPLFGAFLSAGLAERTLEDQSSELTSAAEAFAALRRDAATLSAADPRVAALRDQAAEQRDLGAFHEARALMTQAIEIDAGAGDLLEDRVIARRLSEADSHYINARSAEADLRRDLAIADYQLAVALYQKVWDWQGEPPYRLLLATERLGDAEVIAGNLAAARAAYEINLKVAETRLAETRQDTGRQRSIYLINIRLGDVAVGSGDLPAAQTAYEASFEISERLAAQDSHNTEWRRDLSVSHERLGVVAVALGDLPAARAAYAAALAIRESVAARDPRNTGWQRDLSVIHQRLGDVAVASGDLAAAQAAYATSLEIAERLASWEPQNNEWQRDLSISHDKIGVVAVASGNLPAARAAYAAGLAIMERLAGRDPRNTEWQRGLSISHQRLGDVAVASGDLPAAQEAYVASFEIAERLAVRDPENSEWLRDLAVSYIKIGEMAVASDGLTAAQEAYTASLEIAERLVARDPQNTVWQRDLFVSHNKLGDVAVASGDLLAAQAAYAASLEIAEQLAARYSGKSIEAKLDLVVTHYKLYQIGDAPIRRLSEALTILKELQAENRLPPVNAPWIAIVEGALVLAKLTAPE